MSNQPWEEPDEQEEPEEQDYPIAIVRSRPIRIRFELRGPEDDAGMKRLVTFYGDRRLAQRPVTQEELKEILDSTAWTDPVPITGLARYSPDGDTLLLTLRAEAAIRVGWFDSDEAYVWLGYRYRPRECQKFPGHLERETLDLFGSLLQGRPNAAIGRLLEEARREADCRHEARMCNGGHPPGRDIAEGAWSNRIRKEIDR